MARCENIGGGAGDDERRPPRLIAKEKDKSPQKVTTNKKRKRIDIEVERATAVAAVVERAKRGGRGSGVCISEAHFLLESQELGTKATKQPAVEETTPQSEEQPWL